MLGCSACTRSGSCRTACLGEAAAEGRRSGAQPLVQVPVGDKVDVLQGCGRARDSCACLGVFWRMQER